MLYFRFDNKNGFKGDEHKSGFSGWYDICLDELSDTEEYNELEDKYGYGTKEYDTALDNLVREYAEEKGYLLDGCSCFELTEDGIEELVEYIKTHPIDEYEEINIFEGIDKGLGHDGEQVAKCTKIAYTGKTINFMKIVDNEDLTITEKLNKIMELVK